MARGRSTSEPAARVERVGFSLPQAAHGRLYRRPNGGGRPAAPAILHGLARRTAPQPQPPHTEPRKPLAGTRKPRRGASSSGAKCAMFGPYWATREPQPFRSVTQADSAQDRPQREAGAGMLGKGMAAMWGREAARGRPPERSTSEPAASSCISAAGSTAGIHLRSASQRRHHLTRSRPQDSASNATAPQWEPRKPLGGTRKPRRSGDSSGARVGMIVGDWPVLGHQ